MKHSIKLSAFTVTLFFLVAFGFASTASAQAFLDSWQSVRAQGMGGAYTAVVDDADALFFNPAGLARKGGFTWTILDPRLGLNGVEDLTELQDIVSSNSDAIDILQEMYGRKVWFGAGAKTAVKVSNIAVAGFVNTAAGISLSNPANTTMNLNYLFDYGVALGAGFNVVPDYFKFGLSARRVDRTGAEMKLGAATLATLDAEQLASELQRRGIGYGLDIGGLFTFQSLGKPTISAVYRNVGRMKFSHNSGGGAPPGMAPELVVGGAMEFNYDALDIRPVIDYRYADWGIPFAKKLHMGVEIDMPVLDLRAGYNQGYYTLGVGVDLEFMRIDVASYGVELGTYAGQQEDRRYVLQMTFDMGFDHVGTGWGAGEAEQTPSQRRRLKQRR